MRNKQPIKPTFKNNTLQYEKFYWDGYEEKTVGGVTRCLVLLIVTSATTPHTIIDRHQSYLYWGDEVNCYSLKIGYNPMRYFPFYPVFTN